MMRAMESHATTKVSASPVISIKLGTGANATKVGLALTAVIPARLSCAVTMK